MKYAHKHTIAATVAATLLALGSAVHAQTPPPPPAANSSAPQMHERMQQRMQDHMARRLAELKQKLQITPAQEASWSAYTSALRPTPMQRPERGEFARLTTPERIDRMRAMRTAQMAEMDKRSDATKTFYSALAPEQKKVFDEATLRGHRGGRGHHGGHHRG
jgi:hypothetical protein